MTETSIKTAKQSGDARDEILAAIRSNLAASVPFDAVREGHHGRAEPVFPPQFVSPSREQLIDTFRTNLASVGGYCTVVADEIEAARVVAEIVKRTGSVKVATSDSEIVKRLAASAETIENASAEVLFGCDIGITSAQWAIAETGTLVLESEKESHRLTSLVPPVHLCIVKASSIRQTLGEILELTSRDLSRTITFVTGASRTSDIELTLAIGVHGPRELHVIVIEDQ